MKIFHIVTSLLVIVEGFDKIHDLHMTVKIRHLS